MLQKEGKWNAQTLKNVAVDNWIAKYKRVLLKQFEILGLSTCVGYKHPDCARVIKLDLVGPD